MVGEDAQLYTIEGVAAAVLMVFTAYLMLSSTTLYTPGETHVTDMQMEQLGNDALSMMDTPGGFTLNSDLQTYIHQDGANEKQFFIQNFTRYLNSTSAGSTDDFHFIANVSYRNVTDNIGTYTFTQHGNYTGREHAVKVTRYVFVPNIPTTPNNINLQPVDRSQTVLLEVLLWRS